MTHYRRIKENYARKRFGQHFLKDQNYINKIISVINPKKEDILVEIGPGLGALTHEITKYVHSLIVIELDRDLAKRLQSHPSLGSKLTIYQQDVLKFDFSSLVNNRANCLRIFGNLPYNISTPIIFHLLKFIHYIKDLHFMMQKEVVDRLLARPGSKMYGRLSVITQYYYQMFQVFDVPSIAFVPKPKVNSAIIHQIPFIHPPYPILKNYNLLSTITMQAFSQRRKILRNSLNNMFTAGALNELDIDPLLRAEDITIEEYCQLANWMYDHPQF